jgi:hypothetical protein
LDLKTLCFIFAKPNHLMKVQKPEHMQPNPSKSFQRNTNKGKRTNLFWRTFGLRGNADTRSSDAPSSEFWKILNLLFGFLWHLSVALHYQYRRRFPGATGLPWFKIAAAIALLLFVTRKDIALQLNFHAPDGVQETASDSGHAFGLGLLDGASERELPPPDPFADSPGDDAQVLATKAYIRRYKEVAVAEMNKFGIPASIKMAQAILETNSGKSKLATVNNNHFGVKCFSKSCEKGHCSNFSDDHHKDFFLKYESAWASWRAHSQLLSTGRYAELSKRGKSYEVWAKGLAELGYATDPQYANKLIRTIEQHQLQTLDR